MENKNANATEKYLGSAKIGAKGQIVIPKEVRDMFGLAPGDSVVIMADSERGIALMSTDCFFAMSESVMLPSSPIYKPGFSQAVKNLEKELKNDEMRNKDLEAD